MKLKRTRFFSKHHSHLPIFSVLACAIHQGDLDAFEVGKKYSLAIECVPNWLRKVKQMTPRLLLQENEFVMVGEVTFSKEGLMVFDFGLEVFALVGKTLQMGVWSVVGSELPTGTPGLQVGDYVEVGCTFNATSVDIRSQVFGDEGNECPDLVSEWVVTRIWDIEHLDEMNEELEREVVTRELNDMFLWHIEINTPDPNGLFQSYGKSIFD